MKKSIMPFLGLSVLTISAFSQQTLELTAKMPELVNGEVVYLWNPIDKGTDSTYVKDKSFSFSKPMRGGGSTFILASGKDAEKTGLGIVMYLEAGKMNIQGNGTGFKGATMTGDAFVSEWLALEKAMKETYDNISKIDELSLEYEEASKLGDESATKSIGAQVTLLRQKVIAAGKNWLDNHLSWGSSAYLVNAVFSQVLSEEEKLDYLNKFTGNAKNQITTAMLSSFTGSSEQWVDKQAPGFTQPDVNGKTLSLEDFKGKYVLVDFWASWCTPCRVEIPELKSVYEKYKDKNFTILSISLDKDKEKWMSALTQEQMTWPQLSDLKGDQNSAAKAYKVLGIPANFLIDPNGKIIAVGIRDYIPGNKTLDKFLSKLIK